MSQNIFHVPRSTHELFAVNEETSRAQYKQIAANRHISSTKDLVSQGPLQFRWQTGGNTWFAPDKSYFRIRMKILKVVKTGENMARRVPALVEDGVAFSMGTASNIWNSIELQLGGQTVERLGEHVAQVEALKTRTGRSKAWMDSVGRDTNLWSASHVERLAKSTLDGNIFENGDVLHNGQQTHIFGKKGH